MSSSTEPTPEPTVIFCSGVFCIAHAHVTSTYAALRECLAGLGWEVDGPDGEDRCPLHWRAGEMREASSG